MRNKNNHFNIEGKIPRESYVLFEKRDGNTKKRVKKKFSLLVYQKGILLLPRTYIFFLCLFHMFRYLSDSTYITTDDYNKYLTYLGKKEKIL